LRAQKLIDWAGVFPPDVDPRMFAFANPSSTGDRTLPSGNTRKSPAVVAYVNQGRWVTDCPAEGCTGAELVNLDAPLFFCCECRNETWGHDLLPIALPPAGKRGEIEAYLLARPHDVNRNWLAHETVADLRDENRARKLKLGPRLSRVVLDDVAPQSDPVILPPTPKE